MPYYMTRIAVLCEGQTEHAFVQAVLCPYFETQRAQVVPVIVSTSRGKGGAKRKGGYVSPFELTKQLKSLCGCFDCVTMMFDYYAFPTDWPGIQTLPSLAKERKAKIETVVASQVGSGRFIPNLIMHEFEGILFAKPDAIAERCSENARDREELTSHLSRIANQFASPEDINDSPETAPSKRILKLVPTYDKVSHGRTIAEKIGLAVLKSRCKCFSAWIERLEGVCRDHGGESKQKPGGDV